MFEKQNRDKEKIDKITSLKNYLYIILVFDVILSFKGIPTQNTVLSIILLSILAITGVICGIIYFEVTDKKGVSIVMGILSLFVLINIFVTGYVIYKTNNYLKEKINNADLE